MNEPQRGECPQCGNPCDMSAANPQRPFCGKRCKLIDLGDWLDERNAIPEDRGGQPWSGNDPTEPGDDQR